MDYWRIGHRGRHDAHAENTLEAFRAAYESGCDLVEFDVQLSRDGVPVIFHDDDCRRLAGSAARVFDLDWEELRKLELRGRKAAGKSAPYRIPSLEQFLAEFGRRPFYLELKIPGAVARNRGYIETLARKSAGLVAAAGPHPDTFLASFHGGILGCLAAERLYPALGGIFEDYGRFREVHSGRDAETASAIRWFSVSWSIFRRYRDECRGNAERRARQSSELARAPEPAARGADGIPDAGAFLIWDIHGEKEFRAALGAGVRGVVADDVELMLGMEGEFPAVRKG
jgi:glycerophosphoryl diester phosphodiesterase